MRLDGPGRLVRRLGWGVADQGLSSLSNFVLGVAVARTAGPAGFGAFGIVFATYLLALGASRGAASDPFVVRYSGADRRTWRREAAASTGTATATGLTIGAMTLLVGAALTQTGITSTNAEVGRGLIALGMSLPGLMLQDAWRYCFFAAGRGASAFVNDLVWSVALVGLLVVLIPRDPTGVWPFIAVWGTSGTLAALVGCAQAALAPRPGGARDWLRRHRPLAGRYLAENLSTSSGAQLRSYGIGAITGLLAVGAVRGAELVLGPMYVLTNGMASMAVAEAARVARRSPTAVLPVCLLQSTVGAAATVAWGAVVIAAAPDAVGRAVLGETWAPAAVLILPTTVAYAGAAAMSGAWSGVRALGAAHLSLRAQLVSSALYLAGSLSGAAVDGARGAAWGTAAAVMVSVGLWWWQLRRAVRDSVRAEQATPA